MCYYNTFLTVSHLAIMRSFSKRANSRRSWMVVAIFHNISNARPTSTIAAITPSTMPRIGTYKQTDVIYRKPYKACRCTLNRYIYFIVSLRVQADLNIYEVYQFTMTNILFTSIKYFFLSELKYCIIY